MLDNAKSFSDTAVVVIERLAGESNDATKQQYKRTEKGGDIVVDDTRTMLELTTEEEDLLNYVAQITPMWLCSSTPPTLWSWARSRRSPALMPA